MGSFKLKIKEFFTNHKIAIIVAIFVGLVCVTPQLIFIFQVGPNYQGIPLMATDDEELYLGRLQEIADGHPLLSSVWFYEYKNNWPVYPPSTDLLVFVLSKIFFLSLVNTLILLKFILPALLFLLAYFVTLKIINSTNQLAKLAALTGGLFISLGYDLVDYQRVFDYLTSQISPENFLVWTRPSNPILGALLIFLFILISWDLKDKPSKLKIGLGGLVFALSLSTYFFTWATILSLSIFWLFLFGFKQNYAWVKSLGLTLVIGILLASPYFYLSFKASQSPVYQATAFRTGLMQSHQLIMNKFTLVSLGLFLLASIFLIKGKHNIKEKNFDWWWLSFGILLSSLWVFNQQIITGLAIWPYHFVQYTIPLNILVIIILLYQLGQGRKKLPLYLIFSLIAAASLLAGLYTQVSAYQINFAEGLKRQTDQEIFNWFNKNSQPETVVLVVEKKEEINRLIPAFTKNNVYLGSYVFFLMPTTRILENYLVELKLKDVKPDELENYINNNLIYHQLYFGGLADVKGIQETAEYKKNKNLVNQNYPDFYLGNLTEQLKKYRVDYLLVENDLTAELIKKIPQLVTLEEINGYTIYQLP